MQTEMIDKLYLELSQVTTATTAREITLERHADALRMAVRTAIPAMRDYATHNPKWLTGDVWQDPNGVHAWLREHDA